MKSNLSPFYASKASLLHGFLVLSGYENYAFRSLGSSISGRTGRRKKVLLDTLHPLAYPLQLLKEQPKVHFHPRQCSGASRKELPKLRYKVPKVVCIISLPLTHKNLSQSLLNWFFIILVFPFINLPFSSKSGDNHICNDFFLSSPTHMGFY